MEEVEKLVLFTRRLRKNEDWEIWMTKRKMRTLINSFNHIFKELTKFLCKDSNCWLTNLGESQHPRVVIVHPMMLGRPMGKPFF